MKKLLLHLSIYLFLANTTYAQKWEKVNNDMFRSQQEQRLVIPTKYESYALDFDQFKEILRDAPKRFETNEKGILINWPMPDEKMQKFRIQRSDVFHPDLAAKYPEIRAYTGFSLTDPTARLKISVSHKGIEGMLLSDMHETVYLDRYLPKSKEQYILYKRSDYQRVLKEGEGTCTVVEPEDGYKEIDYSVRFGDCQLRKYRLALACTGEYATFHGGSVQDVLAEYNASMIRVNGIYERDFTITMELVPNTDELIFLNGTTDPYTNNDGGDMLSQNQSTVNQIIGTNNYDIGHVYSTGGGGIASLRSPCTNRKAQGVTGLGAPTGDPFWVDYVAHEMGHQFGGNHTQNNSCQRNGTTSVEPGSASTIMGYAGICTPNVQNNSDDYFHSVTLAEVANFVVAGAGSCAEIITIDNSPPEILEITETGQVLPVRTPFYLTAEASDPENDMITYCWEQIDSEVAQMPPSSASSSGPAFRSFDPTISPTRYFPALPSLLTGVNGTTWEVLPNTDRDMNFSITARDNNPLGGCTDDDNLSLSFTSSAGPFRMTSQNLSSTWNSGTTEMITWDVANTDSAPVSCANVDILLSLDQGENFDIILAENVPNDGEHDILVPFDVSSQGRIMVKCSSSTFFDINNRNINIIAPFAQDISPSSLDLCPEEVATFVIDFTVFGDDPFPVTYTLNGLPAGATFAFSPAQVSEDSQIILNIDNLTNDLAGLYELDIVAQADMVTLSETITLNLNTNENATISYLNPEEGQQGLSLSPILSWESMDGVNGYEVQVSENPNFENIVYESTTMNTFVTPAGLNSKTIYYWRARGMSNCVEPIWQTIYSFQTRGLECETESIIANENISNDGTDIVESEVILSSGGIFGDLEISMVINHTYVGDLSAILVAPDDTEVILFDRPGVPASDFGCNGENLVVTFSASAPNTNLDLENTCNENGIAIEGSFQPQELFSVFEGMAIAGTWKLIVEDDFSGDGGELVSWSIQNCSTSFIDPGVILQNNVLELNSGVEGIITNSHLSLENSDPANTWFLLRSMPSNGDVQKWNESLGIFESIVLGDRFTQAEVDQDMIRYVLTDPSAEDDSFIFDTQDDNLRFTSNNTFLITADISSLNISATISNQISCFGAMDGRIEAMGIGGLPDYTYSLNGGEFSSQNSFDNLDAGSYTITVKDDIGEEFTSVELTITEPDQITFVFFIGDNEITIDAEGGTGELMYSLDGINYSAANSLEIFDGTTYRIYVKDENDCISESIMEMTFYQIGGAVISVENIDCKGNTNGSITINSVSGGLAPYTYQINENIPIDQNTFTNLSPGMYTIKVIGDSGSTFTQMDVSVTEPEFELLVNSLIVENSITLNGSGGTAPYEYSLDGINFSSGNVFSDLADAEYTCYVRDTNGCEATTTAIILMDATVNPDLEKVKLYPNPTYSNFILGSETTLNLDYQIIDITGKTIKQGNTNSNDAINVDYLSSGLFLIKVTFKESTKTFKLSKI